MLLLIVAILTTTPGSANAVAAQDSTLESRLQHLVELHVQETYPDSAYKYEVSIKRIPNILQDVQPEQISRIGYEGRGLPKGYVSFSVYFKRNGNSLDTRVQYLIDVWKQLPVAASRIESGQEVSPDLFTWQWVNITRLTGNHITDPGEFTGKVSERIIKSGEPVRATDLKAPPVVQPGDQVSMKFQNGALVIDLTCTVRQDAAVGEKIRVYSEQTRKTYAVEVINQEEVKWIQTL